MAVSFEQPKTEIQFQHPNLDASPNPGSLNLLTITGDQHPRNAGAQRHGREANDTVMHVLKQEVNHEMGRTPEWAPREMRNPPPRWQCASTASNIYREAMLASHVIDSANSTSHRGLEQVLVPNWVSTMEHAGLAAEIPRDQIRPGDVVVGLGGVAGKPENNDRHIGFVGDRNDKTHRFAAYSNSMGTLREQDLDARFGHYREEHFYRIYFPS